MQRKMKNVKDENKGGKSMEASSETTLVEKLEELLWKHSYPAVMDMATAAEYLDISYGSLAREARLERIKYKKYGNKKLFKREWLDEWMEGRY